jgi:hypothetical protein
LRDVFEVVDEKEEEEEEGEEDESEWEEACWLRAMFFKKDTSDARLLTERVR